MPWNSKKERKSSGVASPWTLRILMTRVSSTGMAAVSLARLSGGVRPESAQVASWIFLRVASTHGRLALQDTTTMLLQDKRFLAAMCTPGTFYELVGPLPPCGGYSAHTSRVFTPTANTPTPKTTARRLRRLFERAAAATVRLRAVLGGPRARQWHELAPREAFWG